VVSTLSSALLVGCCGTRGMRACLREQGSAGRSAAADHQGRGTPMGPRGLQLFVGFLHLVVLDIMFPIVAWLVICRAKHCAWFSHCM
jgi:hypothetical protein